MRTEVQALLESGPLIARAALQGEDEQDTSAAGLGLSIGGLHTLQAVEDALARIQAQGRDPWLRMYRRSGAAQDWVILQHHVPLRWLVAIADPPDAIPYVEAHDPAHDPLARGTTPRFAGPLDTWPEATAQEELRALLGDLEPWRTRFPHGLDLEIAVDHDQKVHLVQLRPLSRALHPGWGTFLRAVEDAGQVDALHGQLTLDAEHNPAPLSVAHAWLMDQLRAARPHAGDPIVLAGWLYVRTLPRALRGTAPTPPLSPRAALEYLRGELLPRARTSWHDLERQLAQATPQATAQALEHALTLFLAMIDAYLGTLVPARSGRKMPHVPATSPLSTADRHSFADVLPAAWDIASPSLAELHVGDSPATPPLVLDELDEDTAATLLAEWDDHLFALGLAPVRSVYRRAATLLGLNDDVFLLRGDELQHALSTGVSPPQDELRFRRQRQRRWASLRPPLRIYDGRPLPVRPTQHLRGIPIGPDFEGPITHRADLEALLRTPPSPDAIVVLPALSAQAALALVSLGLRAVCCEFGGAMSHAALMTRELSLSALIGCSGCSSVPEGTYARIDTRLGRLWCTRPAGPPDRPV